MSAARQFVKAIRYVRMRPGSVLTLLRCFLHNLGGAALTLAGARRVRCNLCGWSGARFAAHPDGMRIKYQQRCPRCESSPRYRLFARFLTGRPEFQLASTTLVEFAPEPSFQKFLRRAFPGTYVTADLRSSLAMIHTDLTRLGLRTGTVDLVLCSHVLEHLPDDLAGLSELHRILKPGGWGILQVPMVDGQSATLEYGRPNPLEHDHYRRYGTDFLQRLASAGFKVELVKAPLFASTEEMRDLGLPDHAILKASRE